MKPRLVDTHAHAHFNAFAADSDAVIQRAVEQGIWVNLVGTQSTTSRTAVEIAERLGDGVFATIGLHPNHLTAMEFDEEESPIKTRSERFVAADYEALAQSPKVIAVGECGLDYYRLPEGMAFDEVRRLQHEGFVAQLDFSDAHDLPTVIHCRDGQTPTTARAHDDILAILRERITAGKNARHGVMHCYTGDWQHAQQYLELGMYISFSGIITFPPRKGSTEGGAGLQETVRTMPLDRVLVETDAPYLAPVPKRGERNEPAYVEHVASYIAEARGLSLEEIAVVTTENALRLFPKMKH